MTEHDDRKPGGLIPPGRSGVTERALNAIFGTPLPAVTETEREQWETLCSVASDTGLCPRPAVDPAYPLRICEQHLGLAVAFALRRLTMTEATELVEGSGDGSR